ncbi:MAG: PadR family transcriptional regulator [Chloroflexi bacterium]|nr:PadR family transcriptional regulator [Chloroflexota bacterium]
MVLPLKPARGGFLRAFRCGWFISEFLLGHGPEGSPIIDPAVGAPQAEICYHYKMALIRATAMDRAARREERLARHEKRAISPDNIEELAKMYVARSPYKASGVRYHSFVVYFSTLRRLGWVEFSGKEESSAFQDHYPQGPPRRYYRLTAAGMAAPDSAWRDPFSTLYGGG